MAATKNASISALMNSDEPKVNYMLIEVCVCNCLCRCSYLPCTHTQPLVASFYSCRFSSCPNGNHVRGDIYTCNSIQLGILTVCHWKIYVRGRSRHLYTHKLYKFSISVNRRVKKAQAVCMNAYMSAIIRARTTPNVHINGECFVWRSSRVRFKL